MERFVFFDTNCVFDKSQRNFFWNTAELSKFSKYAKIIIPDGVMIERKQQILREFNKQRDKLQQTMLSLFNINLDINWKIEELQKNIEVEYITISLQNTSILHEMKNLAFTYQAPFWKSDEDSKNEKPSDKWFKDCYILFTILEFIENNPWNEFYICVNDSLLIKAFNDLKRDDIITIKNFEDFKEKIKIVDGYLQERLTADFNEKLNLENKYNFKNLWKNSKRNDIFHAESLCTGKLYRLEIDNGEILNYVEEGTLGGKEFYVKNIIDNFIETSSVDLLFLIQEYQEYFLTEELIQIFQAIIHNDQISLMIENETIHENIDSLVSENKDILDEEMKNKLEEILWGNIWSKEDVVD